MSRQRQLYGSHSESLEYDFGNLPDEALPFEQIETWTQWTGLAGAGTTHGLPSEVEQFVMSVAVPFQDSLDGMFSAKSGGTSKPGGGGTGGGTGGTVLSDYISGAVGAFNIEIKFGGTWTVKQQSVVTWAADLLSKIITADITDDTMPGTTTKVDDVHIDMSVGSIDRGGSILFGNTLAQTQITSWRTLADSPGILASEQFLPVTSTIKLDTYDLSNSTWASTWDLIVLHEMVHAIGFAGNVFQNKGLVDALGNFAGLAARTEYGGAVPLESGGGTGTAGSHWSETGFHYGDPLPAGVADSNELMTGYIGKGEQAYLSDVTVAALHDLGYTVADPSPTLKYAMLDSGLTVL
jgi:hypothetical protein